jgi:aromatic-amino-acid transaminase
MLSDLKPLPGDKILALMGMYRDDPRPEKIDLGVGIYKNAEGVTPVMRAVKAAEKTLWEEESTKSYTALSGDPAYSTAMAGLILGDAVDADRIAAIATPGGTGAIRQAFELVGRESPEARIWVSAPTWPNHLTILKYLDRPFTEYRYFDETTCKVDFEGMLADLDAVQPGDVVLLHGCCHNPTGANLTLEQWGRVTDLLEAKGAIPMVDIAYQGFGDGLDADAAGLRLLAGRMPELLIAASCSKNFGVYRERAGVLIAIAPEAEMVKTVQGNLNFLNRQNYSFPPDHGARLVTMILNDPDLRREWQEELEEMRQGMLALRQQLADELRRLTNSDRFDFIAEHRGMFSRLGLAVEEVQAMRKDFGIYMVDDSRINIAGLNAKTVPVLARAIAKTIQG